MQAKANPQKSFSALVRFFCCLAFALLVTYFLREPDFTQSQLYVLFLLFFSIGLWTTEAIPAFSVSLFIMAFLVFALGNHNINDHPEDISIYVNTFSSSVIWLMLGGFFLASAMSKTELDQALLDFALRIGGNTPRKLLMGLMLTTMTASMIMSNTATTAMVLAALMPLLSHFKKKNGTEKAFLIGIPLSASTGGMATIIGSPSNAIAVGALEHTSNAINFLDWLKIGLPLSILLTAIGYFILVFFYLKDNSAISAKELETEKISTNTNLVSKRKQVIWILFITVLLWLTHDFHGISVAGVSALPIVLLPLLGILTNKDMQSLPWDTLLLVAGGLSLGVALQHTQILTLYTAKISRYISNPIVLLFLFGLITMLFSNIMSHTAASTIMVPLGLSLIGSMPAEVALVVGLSASTAILLPISTPPNAIAFGTGLMQQKDFRKTGLIIGLLGPLLVAIFVLIFW